jgi:hypothetical protein
VLQILLHYQPWQHRHDNESVKMTKSETREVTLTIKYGQTLGADYMARALSALYRAARSTKSQNEILAIALAYSVVSNSEFIVS